MNPLNETKAVRLVRDLAGVQHRSKADPSLDKMYLTADVVRRMKSESVRAIIYADAGHSKMAAAFAYRDRSGIALRMTSRFAEGDTVPDYADAFDYTRQMADLNGLRPIDFSDWRGAEIWTSCA